MRSQLVERLGSQEPVVQHSPPDVVSLAAAEEAIELADAYGVCDGHPLSESQKITLRNGGGERADGTWAASRVADFGPRQGTGKNDKIAAWELAHLLLFGTELVIHTAHEFPTANESFLRLVAVFDAWDELTKKVARIRYANGEQGIELLSGQRLKYRARTGGSGRGFAKAGLLVYDEAQHLAREHVAASGPTKMANPNSQTWYAGSGGLGTSAVAWDLRRAALLGTGGRLAYTEMTGESLSVIDGRVSGVAPDPTDRDVWYRCIPGLGRWVTEEAVEAMYDELGPALFMREIECVWDPETGDDQRVIPVEYWSAVCSPTVAPQGRVVVGVDVNPERSWAAIAVSDSSGAVELVEYRPGTGWLAGRALEIAAKWSAPVALDPAGPAGSVQSDIEAGATVIDAGGRTLTKACGSFYDDVMEGRARIRRHTSLDAAVAGARKRSVGDAWAWARKDTTVDVTPLMAATVARWAALHSEPAESSFFSLDSFFDEEDVS